MRIRYRPEIDGLRAIAVGSVILYHAQLNFFGYKIFNGGFIGVDIFFVISGYLITSIILKELITTGSFSLKNFYERRIRRILPALLFVMLISIPIAWIYLLPSSLIDYSKSVLYSLGFSSNYYFHFTGQQYGAESGLLKPFLHTWSLSIEEQYYILFPIILVTIYKYFKNNLIYILTILFFFSLFFSEIIHIDNSSFSFYSLPTRSWELLAGAILAYLEFNKSQNKKNYNLILPTIGLFLISYSIFFFSDNMLHLPFYTIFPIFGVCLIIHFSNKDDLVTKILSSKLFVGIGLISYSLYLWHYPIFAFYRYSFAQESILFEILLIIFLFTASIFSYFIVEKKFRDKNNSFKSLFIIMISFVMIIFLANSYFIYKKGFPQKAVIDGISLDKNYYIQEINEWEKNNRKKIIKTKNKKIITVVGDSHAENFILLFKTNPKLFSEFEFQSFGIDEFQNILNNKNNEISKLVNKSNIIVFSFFYDEKEFIKLEKTIQHILTNSNKKIILTTNNPVFNLYASRFTDLDFFILRNKRKPNTIELIDLEKKYYSFLKQNLLFNENNKKLKELSNIYNLKLLDKFSYQCNDYTKRCFVLTNNDEKINWDSDHHTLNGAKFLGKIIYNLDWFKLD